MTDFIAANMLGDEDDVKEAEEKLDRSLDDSKKEDD
jgi:hypothetical protein